MTINSSDLPQAQTNRDEGVASDEQARQTTQAVRRLLEIHPAVREALGTGRNTASVKNTFLHYPTLEEEEQPNQRSRSCPAPTLEARVRSVGGICNPRGENVAAASDDPDPKADPNTRSASDLEAHPEAQSVQAEPAHSEPLRAQPLSAGVEAGASGFEPVLAAGEAGAVETAAEAQVAEAAVQAEAQTQDEVEAEPAPWEDFPQEGGAGPAGDGGLGGRGGDNGVNEANAMESGTEAETESPSEGQEGGAGAAGVAAASGGAAAAGGDCGDGGDGRDGCDGGDGDEAIPDNRLAAAQPLIRGAQEVLQAVRARFPRLTNTDEELKAVWRALQVPEQSFNAHVFRQAVQSAGLDSQLFNSGDPEVDWLRLRVALAALGVATELAPGYPFVITALRPQPMTAEPRAQYQQLCRDARRAEGFSHIYSVDGRTQWSAAEEAFTVRTAAELQRVDNQAWQFFADNLKQLPIGVGLVSNTADHFRQHYQRTTGQQASRRAFEIVVDTAVQTRILGYDSRKNGRLVRWPDSWAARERNELKQHYIHGTDPLDTAENPIRLQEFIRAQAERLPQHLWVANTWLRNELDRAVSQAGFFRVPQAPQASSRPPFFLLLNCDTFQQLVDDFAA